MQSAFEAYGPVVRVEPLPIRYPGPRSAIVVFGDAQSLDRAIHAASLGVDGAQLGISKYHPAPPLPRMVVPAYSAPAPGPSAVSFAPKCPPPPRAPSPAPAYSEAAYSEASYERLVAELAEVKCAPSEGAMQILKEQEVTVEDLCDLTHAMLVAAGVEPIDVHKIWSKIEVLRNRKIAREAAGMGSFL